MLRISKLTDYALLIMGQLAIHPGQILSAHMLADVLHLSVPTVSKVLKMLAEAQLVHSIRGAEGGYQLSMPADKITIANIIACMEGELALTECCQSINLCAIDSWCMLQKNWIKINHMIHSLLNKVSLVDLIGPLPQSRLQTVANNSLRPPNTQRKWARGHANGK